MRITAAVLNYNLLKTKQLKENKETITRQEKPILKTLFKRKNINMSNIQDIHALEQHIYDIVQDYVNGNYNVENVISIDNHCGKITLSADAQEAIKPSKTTDIYPLKALLRRGDDDKTEPDIDKISDLANTWLFLE